MPCRAACTIYLPTLRNWGCTKLCLRSVMSMLVVAGMASQKLRTADYCGLKTCCGLSAKNRRQLSADRARSHPRLLAKYQRYGPKIAPGVRQDHAQRHRMTIDLSGKPSRMDNPPIDGIRINIKGAVDRETAISTSNNSPFYVAECAADVNMGRCVRRDETGVVAAPGSRDIGNWRCRSIRAANSCTE